MDRNLFLAVTGYYGTGSSAVIDLLKEYSSVGIAAPIEPYEHMVFYSPGALFDLSSILLGPFVSAYTSDMAINSFYSAAKRLNNNDFGWFGSYKRFYGDKYLQITNEFISSISCKKPRRNAAHVKNVKFSLLQVVLQLGAKFLYGKKINKWGRKYVYDSLPGYFALPSKNEFVDAAKKYTHAYMKMCSKDCEIEVFDHLIWPQQVDSINMLFPDNFKVIVVQRDPRDLYLLNKYIWHKLNHTSGLPYFSLDVEQFIDEWRRTVYINKENENVLYVYFEDLIYKYDTTIKTIEEFLQIGAEKHIYNMMHFKPQASIENTQIFNLSEEWKREIAPIESALHEYLYNFPIIRVPNQKLMFDV